MGQTALLAKLVTENKDCEWIYRFRANPGWRWGGIVPPSPVLAPGSALGSRPRVALSSAQESLLYVAHLDHASAVALALSRRLASAAASFCRRAAEITSARPASLSAG